MYFPTDYNNYTTIAPQNLKSLTSISPSVPILKGAVPEAEAGEYVDAWEGFVAITMTLAVANRNDEQKTYIFLVCSNSGY